MPTPAEAIRLYIRAKDDNRAHLMPSAFTPESSIEVALLTEEISFPARSAGLEVLTEAMIRRFNVTYENIHTFCLGEPPAEGVRAFRCPWLVGMSEKDGRRVRVGTGHYDWHFAPDGRVRSLIITIAVMKSLDPGLLEPVMRWVSALPYPWCRAEEAARAAPGLPDIAEVLDRIRQLPASAG